MEQPQLTELIESLKKDFNGSADYHSGVNDGMYHLMHNILLRPTPTLPGSGNVEEAAKEIWVIDPHQDRDKLVKGDKLFMIYSNGEKEVVEYVEERGYGLGVLNSKGEPSIVAASCANKIIPFLAGASFQPPPAKKSCTKSCGPGDWRKGGKCDINGCYEPPPAEGKGDDELQRLYDWIMDEKREPAQTKFTSGWLRNVAKEIEFRLSSTTPVQAGEEADQDEWFDVKEKLPEDGEIVDTWNGKANRRSIFKKVAGGIFDRHIEPHANERIYAIHFPDVTHWRYLPTPPQTNLHHHQK